MSCNNRKYSFFWEIKNFSMCALEESECIDSPSFRAVGGEWFIKLYPYGNSKTDEYLSCFLYKAQYDETKKIHFTIELIGENNEVLQYFHDECKFDISTSRGSSTVIEIDKLKKMMKRWKKDILTIHCLIENSNSKSVKSPVGSKAQTKIGVDRCNFEWNIKFSDISNLENRKYLFINQTIPFEFFISEVDENIEIHIRRLDEEISTSKLVSCKISLMNLKRTEIETSKAAKYLFKSNSLSFWNFPIFFPKSILIEKSTELVKNDTFILKCEFSASTGEFLSEFKNVMFEASNDTSLYDSSVALHDDLRNMFITKKNSDAKLRVNYGVNSQIILAHKFILIARSPVFSAMFDKDMLENQTGIVDIEDIDSKTMNSFLEYVYTGNVEELSVGNTMKLLVAADKYQVSSLTEKCFIFLKSKLSIENVCEVFTIADLIHHKRLKSSAFEYIEMNSARVISSKFWRDWMKGNVELANEILYKLALGSSD